mmetsp:Transcript_20993/g.27126  ORF Transcript_20993/g.27126 Transcript_20993/m.27126 type:complete len:93 (+) Transcript_20993:39-317(+)
MLYKLPLLFLRPQLLVRTQGTPFLSPNHAQDCIIRKYNMVADIYKKNCTYLPLHLIIRSYDTESTSSKFRLADEDIEEQFVKGWGKGGQKNQ